MDLNTIVSLRAVSIRALEGGVALEGFAATWPGSSFVRIVQKGLEAPEPRAIAMPPFGPRRELARRVWARLVAGDATGGPS